ncbi:helix-turn-helix transcriptional regulator [Vagococcus sp.]|uniref:helix-turn-helix transcriptional regulator n=1 Tax=Vagococcus sp. TaxID=1933889 RepID=UPI002FCC0BA0
MNISRQSISKWERGDALPSVENLISLSELLNLSLDELILNQKEIPLPFNFGAFKSRKVFWAWMLLPLAMIISGLYSFLQSGDGIWTFVSGVLIAELIQTTGMVDLRRYYTYFTVTKTGIDYFSPRFYCPKIIREILSMYGKRSSAFINYYEVNKMSIYFNNKGYQGEGTTVAYRPRQVFYNREQFLLILEVANGEKIELNLDRAYFSDSQERKYFCGLFDFFESRGVEVEDPYHILKSIKNEYSIIEEAYKLKEKATVN